MSTDNLNGTLSSTGNLNGTFGTSGGGGTSNYNDLANKPQINGNTLEGNKTPAQLGINIPDMTNYYNKSETNTLLNGKANVSDLPDMNDYYDKSETDNLLDGKADTSDLPDMNNYYNKSETDNLLDGKVNNSSFNAAALPIESGSTTNTKDYIDNRGLGDLSNVVLTSPQATQMLQFANVGGQLKLVNTSRNAIRHTTVSGTTDSTGDILCSDLPLASYQILSAYKNRNIAGQSAVAYCILGANNNTHPYIHCINSSNANLANTAVTIEVYYVEI